MTPTSKTSAPPRLGWILAIVLISFFMIILDNSVIFTGLPSIKASMHLDEIGLSWATNAYTLVFGGFLLLGARSGDLLGRRRMFIIGMIIFALASLLVGAAPTGGFMIAARALQGIGAAIVTPLSLSLLITNFPEGRERIRAISLFGLVAGIGAALGLVVGGAASEWVSWRAGFLINVPIGIAMIIATIKFVPETATIRGRFDLPGALLSTLGVGGIIFGVVNSASDGWTAPLTLTALIAGAVLIALLIVNEARAAMPIMPLAVFRNRERSGAYIGRLLFGMATIPFFFFTSQFLQGVFHFSPFETGLAFLPVSVGNFVVAINVPRLSRRFGSGIVLTVGLALLVAGLGWLSQVHSDSPYVLGLALPMAVIGLGQGLALGPLTAAGVAGASGNIASAASGLVNTSQQLGGTLGIALLVAFTATTGNPLAGQVSSAYSYATLFMAAALLTVLFLIVPVEIRKKHARRLADLEPATADPVSN